MATSPRLTVSIAFPTKDRVEMLRSTIEDVRRDMQGIAYEFVIVDGQSTDGTAHYLEAQDDVRLIMEERPEGCRKAFDTALRACEGEFVCWLNDDVSLRPGSISSMLDFMRAPENADVGIGAFPVSTSAERLERFVFNCYGFPPVPYADMGMIRRETLRQVGYLDSRFHRFGWDPNLSLNIWALGLSVRLCTSARVTHYFHNDTMRSSLENLRAKDTRILESIWEDRLRDLATRVWTTKMLEEVWPFTLTLHKAEILLFLGETEKLTELIRSSSNAPALMDRTYQLGLQEHRKGNYDTAKTAYTAVSLSHRENPQIQAWAHFKLAEMLLDQGERIVAQAHLARALELKPDLDKAKAHLADLSKPLAVGFGKLVPPGFVDLAADPGNDFSWEYLFERRKPDAVFLARDVLEHIPECALSNAVRHLGSEGTIWSPSQSGMLAATVGDIKAFTSAYANEFSRWRDALLCGWLLAKAPQGLNERLVEWPWVLERAKELNGRGRVLDVGSYHTPLPRDLARQGLHVAALDINPISGPNDDNIELFHGDIRSSGLLGSSFDAVSCVSTLEHVGLAGRYGITDPDPEGDFKALREIHRLLVPGGRLWLTVPFGCRDIEPVNRCYDLTRLTRFFEGFSLAVSAFFLPGPDGVFSPCGGEEASSHNWLFAPWYALGLFELRKED